MISLRRALFALIAVGTPAFIQGEDIHKGNWLSWRGPLQTGVSLESFEGFKLNEEPVWTDDISGQGTPVVFKGRLYT